MLDGTEVQFKSVTLHKYVSAENGGGSNVSVSRYIPSSWETFRIELEQYPTGPHIASRMLFTAENSFGDVSDKVVADFGCGCGTLGIAAALLGADHVIGFDVDAESLEIAYINAEDLELDMNFVHCNIRNLGCRDQTSGLAFFGAISCEESLLSLSMGILKMLGLKGRRWVLHTLSGLYCMF